MPSGLFSFSRALVAPAQLGGRPEAEQRVSGGSPHARGSRGYGRSMADLLPRLLGALALLLVASVVWLVISRRRGTLRAARRAGQELTLGDFGDAVEGGDRLTVVQISAPICSNCRASERRWRGFVDTDEGAAFSVVMAEDHLEVISRLGILSTPSSAVFDESGRLSGVIRGVPSREQIQDLREPE